MRCSATKEVLTINLESGEIDGRIRISGASYKGILFTPDGTQLVVSTSVSSKTEEKEGLILRLNVESDGDLETGKVIDEILVDLHASSISKTPDGRFVVVANANSDTLSVIDVSSNKVIETISTRPNQDLPFGSSPNAHVFSPDGTQLYVSNGTNNAVAVFDFAPPVTKLSGLIPIGWYPAGLAFDETRTSVYVANLQGIGSRDTGWEGTRKVVKGEKIFGFDSHDHMGSVSLILISNSDQLKQHTANVANNNRQTTMISPLASPRTDAPPRIVPARHSEPSVVKHVLYIIKENQTYDQVFGDIEKGKSDASLCIYGDEVTPNHHKLVNEFVLLDNFYCSGILSADGHQWTDEAYVTSYIEKAFGGFPRSYPYDGGDALAYASSGFL